MELQGGLQGAELKDEEIPYNGRDISDFRKKCTLGSFLSFDFINEENQNCRYSARKKPRQHKEPVRKSTSSNKDLINTLPDECILEIFRFLPSSRDRCSCVTVSKRWLALQATMRISELKSDPKSRNNKISECLQGKNANDTRLAAIAVGTCLRGGLSELCIDGSSPNTQGITDIGLGIIALACPGLKTLSLWNCTKVGNKGIESIARGCNSLEKLDLVNLPIVDDGCLLAIAKNCPSISCLAIDSCPLVGDTSLEAFARYSSKIESLSVSKCPQINASGVILIVSSLPKISKLKLVSLTLSDSVLEAIGGHAKCLSCIILDNISGITQAGFGLVGMHKNLNVFLLTPWSGLLNKASSMAIGDDGFMMSRLTQISVRKCNSLTDKGLKELSKSTSLLESLVLEECRSITWNGLIQVFINCSATLKTLSLVRCRGIADDISNLQRTCLPKYPRLHSLTLKKCHRIGDLFLAWIGHACIQVKHLTLVGLKLITDQGVINLIQTLNTNTVHRLVSVDMSGSSGITDLSVYAITSIVGEKLRCLILDGCERLSDLSLKMISERCPCLIDLGLSRCCISDDGIFCLTSTQMRCLKVLSLGGCVGITDRCLNYLLMIRGSLVGLDLKHCPQLTKEGIDAISETLWWCDLLHY
ncbi:PREDICTED: EIN3-binding F-box protein 2-like [Nelumbo nucifera]|uniref:EIN3-binding F-box protein 1-like n=2 Tax=Nelumbo nucifera TaxID=4432 RepID=A0A822YEU6_NELNU|nr:PREDICTED: EIN3-binding F-box protein 2-like [Nelumbo nucifera]DAD28038.1 TPA_asm: hypothetical protein HUJ06_029506 [Nelumbo nucifera]